MATELATEFLLHAAPSCSAAGTIALSPGALKVPGLKHLHCSDVTCRGLSESLILACLRFRDRPIQPLSHLSRSVFTGT